ncbi:YiiD C-terminal domain-containing protein [Pelobium manganitolerans]|uniref:YiiD C-terminal domain-containing protein n=1 Tax=Pelobium manganitolerans TaxID=1842495 RepID=UPI003FA3AE84
MLRFYPPLFFQRIWVLHFGDDFKSVTVKINRSILNINYNKTLFGGSIFSASDPFYALLFDQILRRKGFKTRVWLKSAHIQYLKPGNTDLQFTIRIADEEIALAQEQLNTVGKFVKSYPIEMYNKDGVLCALVQNEVYVRNLRLGEKESVAY